MSKRQWTWMLVLTCIALAVLMQIPQLLHQLHPLSQGRIIELNDDEPAYFARVEEALTGRPELAEEGFVGDPSITGMHFAFIEKLYGYAFGWTGWSAPVLLQVMDSVEPVLLFLSLYYFLLLCGFSRARAYAGCLVFLLVSLYYLDRPINQRASSLFLLLTLISIILALERHVLFGIIAGILLALLIDIYFWSWTFGWAWFGLLILLEGVGWWQVKTPIARERHRKRFLLLCGIGTVAAVAAIPILLKIWQMMHHPLIEVGKYRAGYHFSHLPESWPYTLLFLGMSVGAFAFMRYTAHGKRTPPYAMIMVITAFIVLNQQIVHGTIFSFASHYQFPTIFAAIACLLLTFHSHPRWVLIPFFCAVIFLEGKLVDNYRVVRQWVVRDGAFSGQHLMTSLPALRALPRARVAADPATSHFIAAYTYHDVVYSIFLKNVIMPHEEMAERFCIANLGSPHISQMLTGGTAVIFDANNSKYPAVRQWEVQTTEKACRRILEHPKEYLHRYGIDYVLWDERGHPEFEMDRYGAGLTLAARGDGWSLWRTQ